jgi:hypothetical protein
VTVGLLCASFANCCMWQRDHRASSSRISYGAILLPGSCYQSSLSIAPASSLCRPLSAAAQPILSPLEQDRPRGTRFIAPCLSAYLPLLTPRVIKLTMPSSEAKAAAARENVENACRWRFPRDGVKGGKRPYRFPGFAPARHFHGSQPRLCAFHGCCERENGPSDGRLEVFSAERLELHVGYSPDSRPKCGANSDTTTAF